jgi:hypothetical protein
MAQKAWGKLADQTSGTATQLSIALPTSAINPSPGQATTGISLAGLDYLVIVAVTNAAVALTQGVSVFGNDAAGSFAAPGADIVTFSVPTAGTVPVVYHVGLTAGANDGIPANGYFGCAAPIWDKMTIQATPGAASTVRLVVYGVRSLP